MPVATSASSSASTSSMQMMHQQSQQSGMTNIPPNGRKKCPPSPTPNFNARSLQKAKWSSSDDIVGGKSALDETNLRDGPKIWAPGGADAGDDIDFKPVKFDSNSLKRTQKATNPSGSGVINVDPKDSFAWKDKDLDDKLNELHNRQLGSVRQADKFDNSIDKSIGNWSKSLPKAPNPDVILLKKAREEKKVKRYLEDNFQHRRDLVQPDETLSKYSENKYLSEDARLRQDSGVGPRTKDGGYTSEPEVTSYSVFAGKPTGINGENGHSSNPPPFHKHESRFEREQKIRVGSVDAYKPGETIIDPHPDSADNEKSSAQKKYEQSRFRVQPGRIEEYSLGRGSIARQEVEKGLAAGCGITRYASSHSFNPLMSSKSVQNLTSKSSTPVQKFGHLQSAIQSGYESDSQLSFKRRDDVPAPTPQTPSEARSAYSQIQRGGDIPVSGLRMTVPERPKEPKGRYTEGEVNIHYKSPIRREEKENIPEEELKKRQEDQMKKFYQGIEQKKEIEHWQDTQNRKHHDTLLPGQKSPIPLDRYDDFGTKQIETPNSTLNKNQYKWIARALYNFQAQNHREISFKKGDLIYIRRQVDSNWYEGERNAMIGIFPATYVEIIPGADPSVTPLGTLKSMKSSSSSAVATLSTYVQEGQGKAKFNFQAQTPMELSLVKGEMVTLTRRIDGNWYEGRIGARRGIFPATYVDVSVEPGETRSTADASLGRTLSPGSTLKPVAAPAAHSVMKGSSGTVLHDQDIATAANNAAAEQYLTPNYTVQSPYSTINSRPSSSMSQGAQQQQSSSSMMTTTMTSSQQQQSSSNIQIDSKNEPIPYRALYNYVPQNDDEVELKEGDIVYVMEKCDDGWFVGTSQRTGIFGTFPGNYVSKA